MTISNKTRIILVVVLVSMATGLATLARPRRSAAGATYSQFLEQVRNGAVNRAVILAAQSGANEIDYSLKSGGEVRSMLPYDYHDALALMQEKMVSIEIRDASTQWVRILANSLPFVLLLAFWFGMMTRLRGWWKTS
jgi:ATP-dependent Zn protease